VEILTTCKVIAVEAGRVVYETQEGAIAEMEVDRVALAVGWRPRGAELACALDGREVRVIGDAERPADFVAAVAAGAAAAMSV
jgi:2,4-dienoyl-CoA reductase (NADPH2)